MLVSGVDFSYRLATAMTVVRLYFSQRERGRGFCNQLNYYYYYYLGGGVVVRHGPLLFIDLHFSLLTRHGPPLVEGTKCKKCLHCAFFIRPNIFIVA